MGSEPDRITLMHRLDEHERALTVGDVAATVGGPVLADIVETLRQAVALFDQHPLLETPLPPSPDQRADDLVVAVRLMRNTLRQPGG